MKIIDHFSDVRAYQVGKDDQELFYILLGGECAYDDKVFQRLFTLLSSEDPVLRKEASEIMEESPKLFPKLISIYTSNIGLNPRIGVLAGRVLGRKLLKGIHEEYPLIHGQVAQMAFGEAIAFVSCKCSYCGRVNPGIPVPENGLYIGFYGQKDASEGVFHLPVLCDYCGKEFYIAWDTDPRSPSDPGYY